MTGAKSYSQRGSKLDKDDILYVCEIKTNDSVAVYKKILPSGFFLLSTKCNSQLMHACYTRRYNNAPS